ncbi:MAG TPA: hypothetical protein VH475_17245 [Tepidisphaeraceae bacterium]
MTQAQQLSDDLNYVRQAVTRRERSQHVPVAIAWMVAIYVLVGYVLLDVNTNWAGLFFAIGGAVMGILGWPLGKRHAIRSGEYDRADAMRVMLHWASILLGIAGVIGLCVARGIQGPAVGQFIVLVIGVIYFLGGVHFDRNFLWLGPVLMAGSIAITYVPRYGWTALGIVIALGLVVPTFFHGRTLPAPQQQQQQAA